MSGAENTFCWGLFAGKECVGSREYFLRQRNVSGAENTFCWKGMGREQRMLFPGKEWVGSRENFLLERNVSGAENITLSKVKPAW